MPMSSSRVRHEDILEHARNTIRPGGWTCEWNIAGSGKTIMCKTTLSSWNAYLKHILNHCQEYRNVKKMHSYVCLLPRCTIPPGMAISSWKELDKHLRNSHLNRSSLQCPVKGCNSLSFRGPNVLQTHYEEDHSDLLQQPEGISSDLLLPSWHPFPPASKKLAPIPTQIPPGSVFLPLVEGTWRTHPSTSHRLSTGQSKYASSPRKPSKMDAPSNPKPRDGDDDAQEVKEFDFDDLPQQLNDRKHYIRNPEFECVVRKKGPWFDVSRPQPLLDSTVYGYRTLPDTILYNAWVRQNKAILDEVDEEAENAQHGDPKISPPVSSSA